MRKILSLAVSLLFINFCYARNSVMLIINNSPYFVTVQNLDGNSGYISLKNGSSHTNWQQRFNVDEISCINYLIPREKWNTRFFIEVFNQPQSKNMDGSYNQNINQRIGWASILQKEDSNFNNMEIIQIDAAQMPPNQAISYGLSKIIPRGDNNPIRIIIDKNCLIRLAE